MASSSSSKSVGVEPMKVDTPHHPDGQPISKVTVSTADDVPLAKTATNGASTSTKRAGGESEEEKKPVSSTSSSSYTLSKRVKTGSGREVDEAREEGRSIARN